AGMLARAASAGFEWLYGLRVMAATAALLAYRRRYRELDWRCSPLLAAAAGVLVFLVWTLAARGLLPASAMPASLAAAPRSWRLVWILTRIAGALITVPIAEELAFRGYLMRRLANEDFDALAYRRVRWPQVAVSAVLFGLMHGPMWPAGIAAGLVFGAIAVRTDRLGNAILAHSIANALIVVAVLAGGQWSYW
ncbi:MAG: CAAX prenyl protease-related protein, partial [Gammaproteobacteria bacterium]|nr:CAAX prenyl protease-related protein [Gammaproteobacteria bacterium]